MPRNPPEPPFKFPEEPLPGAPMESTLRYTIAVIEEAVKITEPLSPRMKALTSVIRVAERALVVFDRLDKSDPAFRNLATILELRDLSRAEQRWIDEWLREEEPEQLVLDAIHWYKIHLAKVESTSMIAIGYVGTDREDDDETGGWWAGTAGAAIGELLAVTPQLLKLPSDNDLYRRWTQEMADYDASESGSGKRPRKSKQRKRG